MEKVTGRSDDMIILRGVNLFPTQIEEMILADARLAPHFLIELSRDGRLDAMKVKVEARDGADQGARLAASRDLVARIKALIGVTAEVETVVPGGIERSIGKAKRIVDLRPKN
jgi:phenylacetate-CoA ligase